MRLSVLLLAVLSLTTVALPRADAQSLDDLELRKRSTKTRLGFGFLGLLETAAGFNRDRPELSNLLLLAPQLEIGDKMRLRLNVGLIANWLHRQENPWDMTDVSIQFAHLNLYTERVTGVGFSGLVRYYFPTSKESRNNSSHGQLRAIGKASRAFGPVFLSLELNGQKYFSKYTTWNPASCTGLYCGGFDEVIDNNASYGFGETLTATVTPLAGLDLSAIGGMYQARAYQPDEGHGDQWGSPDVQHPRSTTWAHSFRFVLDATYGLGSLPWLPRSSLKKTILSKTFVSLGYSILAPQLQNGGRERSLNPFNPKYASAYLDVMVLY